MANERITDAQIDALTAELDKVGNRANNQELFIAIRMITANRSAMVDLAQLLKKHDSKDSAIAELLAR